MFERDFVRFIRSQILGKIGLTLVGIEGRSTAAGDDQVHAMRPGSIGVALDPVLEQMIVSGEHRPDVVDVEERHVAQTKRGGGGLHISASLGACGKMRGRETTQGAYPTAGIP